MIGAIASHYVATGGGASYSAAVLADSPLAYYRLGEASGTTMLDSSGNGRNGTYSGTLTLGTPGLVTGDSDTCVDFASGQGRVTSAAWMNVTTITVEAIVNLDSTSGIRMILERDDQGFGGTRAFQFRVNAGKLEFVAFTGAGIVGCASATTLATATKYHVCATYDGANIRLYVNGTLDQTNAIASTLNTGAQDLLLGRSSYASSYPIDGRVDEVAIFGSALTGARIAAHAAAA